MAIQLECRRCHSKMAAADGQAGGLVKCPNCDRIIKVPQLEPSAWYQATGAPRPKPQSVPPGLPAVLELTAADWATEHLRVIRQYTGWLLVLVAAPVVLWTAALLLWLLVWLSAPSADSGLRPH